ncbi:hypothetical protein HNQ91_002008 [Filimonas zeae]|uniref:CHAT domain-containing protein n=1 Tax=Filimonas zeae TaxID=1737353 RepID=A0A917IXG1_9BACT|nr:hypothetical protein [Filimonas zeae]MDR6338957.1 hypothetical protein [Filimonas zeae]GGH65781.1 hypothetical protein GCM10011379_19290 [Filimonas zeae]
MKSPEKNKWVKLSIQEAGDRLLLLYEDGLGRTTNEQSETRDESRRVAAEWLHDNIYIPVKTDILFAEMCQMEPRFRNTGGQQSIFPTSVYLELPASIAGAGLPLFLARHIAGSFFPGIFKQYNNEIIVMEYVKGAVDAPFSLPLNINIVQEYEELVQNVLKSLPGLHNESVQSSGIRTYYTWEADLDILILAAGSFSSYLHYLQEPGRLPRLIVVLYSYPDDFLPTPKLKEQLPATNLIFLENISPTATADWLKILFTRLLEDFSLPEILLQYDFQSSVPYPEITVYSSPESGHYLRISTAADTYLNKIQHLAATTHPGNNMDFITRVNEDSTAGFEIRNFLQLQRESETDSFSGMEALFPKRGFMGFTNLSLCEQRLTEQMGHIKHIQTAWQELVNNRDVFELLRKKQERRVNVMLDEFTDTLTFTPVDAGKPLYTGRTYRLTVLIGQSLQENLVEGLVQAIDPLLPDPENKEGHLLDIVVFAKEFRLQTAALQQVKLPLLGASEKADFLLVAPALPEAQLRICVFFKNSLLQAFILEAGIIREKQDASSSKNLSVKPDLATSEKFTNLDEMPARDLYIGMNKDAGGTHTLFVKKDDVTCEVHALTPQMIEEAQKAHNQLLTNLYFTPEGYARFSFRKTPGTPPDDAFLQAIKKMARSGERLLRQLHGGTQQLRDALALVREQHALNIQIGRHNMNNAFPWPLLYDYILPYKDAAREAAFPVCMGRPFAPDEHAAFRNKKGFGCPHNPDTEVFCVEGFWGLRHKIEQIITGDTPSDNHRKIELSDNSSILLVCNSKDPDTDRLHTTLKKHAQLREDQVVLVNPTMNLMDWLWDNQRRPVMLIVVGHMETQLKANEPEEPRILTFPPSEWNNSTPIPKDKWIYEEILFNYYYTKKRWKDAPLPLVLLINCSSAQLNVTGPASIVRGFWTSGACAIVGTECDITSGLAARFVEEVTGSLLNGVPLGDAIQLFNSNLVQCGNPPPFVFTCYGSTDLTFTKQ